MRHERACLVAEHVRGLVVDNLMVDWPETDAEGNVIEPEGWHWNLKGNNGSFTPSERELFNTGRIPDFAIASLRDVHGGYLDCPLAAAPQTMINIAWMAVKSRFVLN